MPDPALETTSEAIAATETPQNLNQVLDKHLEIFIRQANSKFMGLVGNMEAAKTFMENHAKTFCTSDRAVITKAFYHEGAGAAVPSMNEDDGPVELVRITIPATPEITKAIAKRLESIPKGGDNDQLVMHGAIFPKVRGAISGLCFGVVDAESPIMINTASLKTEGKIHLMMRKSDLTDLVDRAIGSKY